MSRAPAIWIGWERHRRSAELADALRVPYHPLLDSDRDIPQRALRYLVLSARTVLLLGRTRPSVVFCQNPSLALAALLCLLKPLFRYRLVVDRHSNFKLDRRKGLKWRLFHRVSGYSIRRADLTIVTNPFLARLVDDLGGRGFVLQDRIPRLDLARRKALEARRNVLCVSTFSEDEPLAEVAEAARRLGEGTVLHVTGNYRRYPRMRELEGLRPPNMVLTGFLAEADYQSLMASCDAALVLTTEEYLLTCGAYEALSLGIPMVLSDTMTIRDYFRRGAVYTAPTADGIASAVEECLSKQDRFKAELGPFRAELEEEWAERFQALKALVRIPPEEATGA